MKRRMQRNYNTFDEIIITHQMCIDNGNDNRNENIRMRQTGAQIQVYTSMYKL